MKIKIDIIAGKGIFAPGAQTIPRFTTMNTTKTQGWTVDDSGTVVKTWNECAMVKANTKAEATRGLLKFAKLALTEAPKLRIWNNAWQLAYWSLGVVTVESGTTEREIGFCMAGEPNMQSVTPDSASFAYYASDEYQSARK